MAERVDVVDAREKKDIKTASSIQPDPVTCVADVEALWPLNANAPRLNVANPPNDNGV